MVVRAKVVALHWEEHTNGVGEATLEVEHPDGDRQLFVIPILRMTERLVAVNPDKRDVPRS